MCPGLARVRTKENDASYPWFSCCSCKRLSCALSRVTLRATLGRAGPGRGFRSSHRGAGGRSEGQGSGQGAASSFSPWREGRLGQGLLTLGAVLQHRCLRVDADILSADSLPFAATVTTLTSPLLPGQGWAGKTHLQNLSLLAQSLPVPGDSEPGYELCLDSSPSPIRPSGWPAERRLPEASWTKLPPTLFCVQLQLALRPPCLCSGGGLYQPASPPWSTHHPSRLCLNAAVLIALS